MKTRHVNRQSHRVVKHKLAFKYVDQNQEAAMLVIIPDGRKFRNRTVVRVVGKIILYRSFAQVQITDAEWDTWQAFDLCPCIEIFARHDEDKHRQVAWREVRNI